MGEVVSIIDKRGRKKLGDPSRHPAGSALDPTQPGGMRGVNLADYAGMTSDRALMSIAQEGIRLADMLPAQKATVAGWMRNEASKAYWRLQNETLGVAARAALEEMRSQMINKAEQIEASLPAPAEPEMVTQKVALTRGEFAAVAAGRYPAGRTPTHGGPRRV